MPGEPLTREAVILGYRMLLGRDPEDEDIIANAIAAWPDLQAFGKALAGCAEFGLRQGPNLHALPSLDAPSNHVETEADAATLALMAQKVGGYWTRAGETAPHWSVLTEERFLPHNIADNLEAFYGAGAWDAQVVDATLGRIGRDAGQFRHCVDYGCGVGRVTLQLARRFPEVTGLDISAPHLHLARETFRAASLAHVTLTQVTPERLMPVESCDFWYSRIVLQHSPPPVAMNILRHAFRALRTGGVAMFQVPVWIQGYHFEVASYLAGTPGAEMEMHAIPQRAILELADWQGLVLRDLREDSFLVGRPGSALSNTFTFEKLR
ncbi:class I SAM-dependent methyltransferase [Sediminicoccus sp. BL-A-41-H5]|uniref:class I SAM-dependent methyltransferase n=1 Tax=Sediminicoccus sp. BL-A-41-H5 TaxID=3421106 RepID=UPI003D6763A3